MKLEWEKRSGMTPRDSRRVYHYWLLTRTVGDTAGISTGYFVGISGFASIKVFASFPDGTYKFFDTEDDAKHYCEVCCRMGVHDARETNR